MIWFLERQNDLLVCEIRRSNQNAAVFEFEIAGASGPTTMRFDSPQELITKYLAAHRRLMADGWRPRVSDIEGLD